MSQPVNFSDIRWKKWLRDMGGGDVKTASMDGREGSISQHHFLLSVNMCDVAKRSEEGSDVMLPSGNGHERNICPQTK